MSAASYTTSDFDYELPPEQIAQHPAQRRDRSRLMVVDRSTGTVHHHHFSDLATLVPAGDVLVLNETRVFPARLLGRRAGGGAAEVLLLHPDADDSELWHALVRPGSKLKPGREVEIGTDLHVEIVDVLPGGSRRVRLRSPLPLEQSLDRYGEIPLPPYVKRRSGPEDRERYQTVYAREWGSVAAPTAGLHFTPELLGTLEAKGAHVARLVLHVGVGTFRPVETEDPAFHRMHSEWYRVPAPAAELINRVRAVGGSIWAVGTTSARSLEAVADRGGVVHPGEGWTDLFIRPPYRFRAVDRLITNFHLPRSTLLMLVTALAGRDTILAAYREAVAQGYRFFSYGDAMAIV